MFRSLALLAVSLVVPLGGCATNRQAALTSIAKAPPASRPVVEATSWIGVYSSPSEIGGFTGTVLSIEEGLRDDLDYRMTYYTDVIIGGQIREKEKRGTVLIDGDKVYIPMADGFLEKDGARLDASLSRYTRVNIRGRTVLMRDDALRAYRAENRLYDYGVLIKVAEKLELVAELNDAKHESIKVFYEHPDKSWRDPFVNGPNDR